MAIDMGHSDKIREIKRHRGVAMVYVIMTMLVMLGFSSMAVDFGRVQVAKTELRRTADAAARAAAGNLSTSSSAATSNAIAIAALNPVDGSPFVLSSSNVQVGWWNTSTMKFTVNANPMSAISPYVPAVKVTALRTKANGNPITLLFAQALGVQTVDITATSIVALSMTSVTVTIGATSNPWLAGEPTGTKGSQPDPGWYSSDHQWQYDIAGPVGGSASSGEPYGSPQQATGIVLIPGAAIQISNVSGLVSNDSASPASYNADGVSGGSSAIYSDDAATNSSARGYSGQSNGGIAGSEFGIANISVPIDSLNAVFLDANLPSTEGTAPPGLDFSTSTAQNYAAVEPLTRQPFFVGNGINTAGNQQTVVVPANATRLYFGIMDGHEWSNNIGSFTATVTQISISVVQ